MKQLPERIDKTLMVEVTQEQLDQHNEYYEVVCRLVNKWKRFGFLSEKERQILLIQLNRMRMVSDSTYILDQKTRHDTKITELRTTLEEIFQNKDEKVVIFSQWERMTRLVAQELEDMGIKFEYLHGGVPAVERKNLLINFKEDRACRVFLSTDAGGVGLNLQSASVLINMDCPWNPAVLEQRIGRIHRLGQTKPVTIINFISRGTIEERMLSLLAFKKQMFEGILDGGEDMIFMGESKMKQFMKTVEQLTGEANDGKNIVEENSDFEDNELISEEQDSIHEYIPVGLQESKRPNHTIESVQNFQSPVSPSVVDLLRTSINILEKLSEAISSPNEVQSMLNRIVAKDDKTGKSYLKIPIETEQLAKAVEGLNTFFQNINR